MTLKQMLANRETVFLRWDEPRTGLSSNGSPFTTNVSMTASVGDCLGMMRMERGDMIEEPDDETLLHDFIVIHGAYKCLSPDAAQGAVRLLVDISNTDGDHAIAAAKWIRTYSPELLGERHDWGEPVNNPLQ